jgi:hypothetical protein
MRLSVIAGDPGYLTYACLGHLGPKVKIKLDGEEMSAVVTADEEEGIVVRYKKDADGHYLAENDEAVSETLHGKVEIIVPKAN